MIKLVRDCFKTDNTELAATGVYGGRWISRIRKGLSKFTDSRCIRDAKKSVGIQSNIPNAVIVDVGGSARGKDQTCMFSINSIFYCWI